MIYYGSLEANYLHVLIIYDELITGNVVEHRHCTIGVCELIFLCVFRILYVRIKFSLLTSLNNAAQSNK